MTRSRLLSVWLMSLSMMVGTERVVASGNAQDETVQHGEASQQDDTRLDEAALAEMVRSVKADLVDSLLDPEAAKFRRIVVMEKKVPSGLSYSVCGEFIGKNAYGAYTGYKRFIGRNGKVAVREDDEAVAGLTESIWGRVCVQSADNVVVWSAPES